MWRRASSYAALVALLLTACQGSGQPAPRDTGQGAESPTQAVSQIATAVAAGDFDSASHLAVPGQAAMASLLEGASFSDVVAALESNEQVVVANFWAGFAQGAGVFFSDGIEATDGEPFVEGDVTFHPVTVAVSDGSQRTLFTRDIDGHRVDLFASFGAGLADKMIRPVERLIDVSSDESLQILDELKTIVPSLLVAAKQPELNPQSIQNLIRLVELITRVS